MAHQCPAGHHQVWAGAEQRLVYKEILLLPAQVAHHFPDIGVEILANGSGCLVHGVERLLQRHFVVERLTGIRDKHGGNHQRVTYHKHGRCGIPRGVAAGLECGADAAVGKR